MSYLTVLGIYKYYGHHSATHCIIDIIEHACFRFYSYVTYIITLSTDYELNNRIGHHAPEDVLECCQSSLKSLQIDCLDLFLVHCPFSVRKTATFPNFSEEDKLYYDPDSMSKTWAVSALRDACVM